MQIRDNAIEATRLKLVRELNEEVGKDNWTMKIRLWPHHILRENKMASGAGADRVSQGMKHAFGKNTGRAAQVRKNDILISVLVDDENLAKAKIILKKVKYKIAIKHEVAISEHKNKRLSGRKKWTREAKIAKQKAAGMKVEEEKKPEAKAEKKAA
jgi:large subunit ribosomal protein L10e